MKSTLKLIIACLIWIGLPAWADDTSAVTALDYTIVQRHAHDSTVFTQGLAFYQGRLYESGGLYGESTLRYSTPGETTATMIDLPRQVFAEGITVHNQQLYLLTWQEKQLHIYDPETLTLQKNLRYRDKGWGLTSDGTHLITSNGSDRITFRDPDTLTALATIDVRENGKRIEQINELEWVTDTYGPAIWANIWLEYRIIRIDPQTGIVTHSVDLGALANEEPASEDPENTLNGIAWDPATQTLWVTGKRWQYLYQLRLAE